MERIEISYRTIIFTILFLIFLWLLYQIRMILLLLFIVLILTAALDPVVDALEKLRISRSLAILIIYLVIISAIAGLIYLAIPPMVEQSTNFFNSVPQILKQIGLADSVSPNMFLPELTSIPGSIFRFLLGAFSNLLGIFSVLVLTFYFLMEKKNLPKYLHFLFANKLKEEKAQDILLKIEKSIGGWVRGELFLMLIIGLLSYAGFRLLGLDYAVALAILAGFLELVPNIGPTIAAIPAVLVGLSMSPILAVGTLCLAIIIQQFENNIIVPQVMKYVVGLNPIVTIICLLIGFKLGGAGGAILAIPLFLILRILIEELYLLKKKSI